MGGLCHVIFFFCLAIPLILLAPRSTPDFVFTQLINQGGWSSDGLSWCLGLLTVTYCFMGKASPFDSSFLLTDFPTRLRWSCPYERRGAERTHRDPEDARPDDCYQRHAGFLLHPRPSILHWRLPDGSGNPHGLPNHPDLLPSNRVSQSCHCHAVRDYGSRVYQLSRRRGIGVPTHMGLRQRWRPPIQQILCSCKAPLTPFHSTHTIDGINSRLMDDITFPSVRSASYAS